MSTRQDAIRRAKALLQKTTEHGATEAEMLAALAKANSIIEAHELTDADLLEARAEAVKRIDEVGEQIFDPNGVKWRVCGAISAWTNVTIYRMSDSKGLRMVGTPSDIAWAQAVLDIISGHVCTKLEEFLWTCHEPAALHRTIRANFADAAAGAIANRIEELTKKNETVRTSKGNELMVIKSGAVKAYLKDHGIHLRCGGGGGGPSNSHDGARAAGRAAGNSAPLGRPIGGSGGVLRIGRS